jgi:acetyl-CoA C-acetyltransferase
MSRVPMGLSHTLPQKNGFGQYVSPAIQSRYPGVQFSQFAGAEAMARKYDLSRDRLDEFALRSHQLAIAATRAGKFNQEIEPVPTRFATGASSAAGGAPGELHTADEGIRYEATLNSIAGVKLISDGGRVTAATASQICDGAAGVMVVNEAFAPVPLAWLRETGADPARLNVHGGAIALGHPLGASGTKLMTTLIYALRERGKRYGLQTMCEGGGLANVTIIERL